MSRCAATFWGVRQQQDGQLPFESISFAVVSRCVLMDVFRMYAQTLLAYFSALIGLDLWNASHKVSLAAIVAFL